MDKRIREGIEASRPGVDDLLDPQQAGLPELAEAARAISEDPDARLLHERVQQWDSAIGASMERVPVPEGLAKRILAQFESADAIVRGADAPPLLSGAVAAASEVVAAAGEADANIAATLETARSSLLQRRYWAGASLSAIAAAALVIVAGYWLQWGSDLPLDQLAQQWQSELTDKWRPMDQAPRGYTVPDSIRVPPSRFQWIGRYAPTQVVAYELNQGQAQAMLYVAHMKRPGLRGTPPSVPQKDTAGQAIGYWHSGDIVYVLVVSDVRNYRAFVKPSSAPLAISRESLASKRAA